MRVEWNLNDVEISDGLRDHMEERIAKLDKRLGSWADDARQILVTFEQVGNKEQWKCKLNLYLPQRQIHAEEVREEKKTAFNSAFDDLMRQEKKMMARFRRKDSYQEVADAKREVPEETTAPGEEEE